MRTAPASQIARRAQRGAQPSTTGQGTGAGQQGKHALVAIVGVDPADEFQGLERSV
jgi:hypothetical protein